VTVTRARSDITFTFAEEYFGYPKKPSRFLTEMGLILCEAACLISCVWEARRVRKLHFSNAKDRRAKNQCLCHPDGEDF
jgi:hypothetical protein